MRPGFPPIGAVFRQFQQAGIRYYSNGKGQIVQSQLDLDDSLPGFRLRVFRIPFGATLRGSPAGAGGGLCPL